MYAPELVKPMSEELTSLGIKELHTSEEVEKAIKQKGTSLIIINSVCGCAAGNARPAVKLAVQHNKLPRNLYTVFAGVDIEATAKLRSLILEYPQSSPFMVLFKDGKAVFALQRHQIEGRSPEQIALDLKKAFDKFA